MKKLLLVVLMLGLAGAVMAQVGIGTAVGPQIAAPGNVPPIPAMQEQGTTAVGNPAAGNYNILVNGWIEAYARVSAYDNWINFGIMSPISGSYAAPTQRNAIVAGGVGLLTGETGGQAPWQDINGSTLNFDLAGIQIQTNARLDLLIDMGGWMKRVTSTGATFAGQDNRGLTPHDYMLRNQVKMVMHGKFLENGGAGDPAQDADGTAYVSPTSNQATDFNDWTDWGIDTNAIPNLDSNDGWFEPDNYDPWNGSGPFVTGAALNGDELPMLNLVVERGQAQASGTGEAAELWFTQRILRRGLQDVAGNYRSDMGLTLTYREADVQWLPTAK